MKVSESKKAEYKFCNFSDAELAHLIHRIEGARMLNRGIHKSIGCKRWGDIAWSLDTMIEKECIRRKIIK